MNILELLLGQLPEAAYFALFIILVRQIKVKRLLFISLSSIEYILLLILFPYNIWSHVLYFAMTYVILKMLYKERALITDIFTLAIASLFMMVISIPLYLVIHAFSLHILIGNVIQKLILFLVLYLLRNKLVNIQRLYKKFWNRNDKVPKRMKSTTFRVLNVIVFNFMFYIINIILVFCLLIRR